MDYAEPLKLYDLPSLYDLAVPPGPCEAFYRDLARDTGGPILELACGTGRLTIPLALDGHDIIALDASPAMLNAARAKAETENAAVVFLQADMRSFELGRPFALAIVSCNSLAHLTSNDDILACLGRIARHLAPGGLLAFDIVNPQIRDLVRADAANIRIGVGSGQTLPEASEELIAYDPVQQIRVMQWQLWRQGEAPQRIAPMSLRTIFPQELPLLLQGAGLELAARYGDFERNPLTGGSLNQVCIARQACPAREESRW